MISEMTHIQSSERRICSLVVMLSLSIMSCCWMKWLNAWRLLQVPPVWFEFMANGALSYNLVGRGINLVRSRHCIVVVRPIIAACARRAVAMSTEPVGRSASLSVLPSWNEIRFRAHSCPVFIVHFNQTAVHQCYSYHVQPNSISAALLPADHTWYTWYTYIYIYIYI